MAFLTRPAPLAIFLFAALGLPLGGLTYFMPSTPSTSTLPTEGSAIASAKVHQAQPLLQVLIPLYLYPAVTNGRSNWQPLADAAQQVPITAVINPHNGPGGLPNRDYQAGMALLQKSGVKMLGYVATNYGQRPWTQVKSEIDLYQAHFPVGGIFLDEAASSTQHLEYYQRIYKYIKTQAKLHQVVTNPGTHTDEAYLKPPQATDTAVVFENFGREWLTYQPSTYLSQYDRRRFAIMLHGVSDPKAMEKYLDLSLERNVGYVYITNDLHQDNPWDTVPSYWSAQIAAIRARNRNR